MKRVLPLALILFGLAPLTLSQKTAESEQQPPAVKLEPSSIDFGDQVAKMPSPQCLPEPTVSGPGTFKPLLKRSFKCTAVRLSR